MTRKMTVVFHDEDIYTELRVQAVRRRMAASDIVADAVREWLEVREDAELLPVVETARSEWKGKGGRSWSEVKRELRKPESSLEKSAGKNRV